MKSIGGPLSISVDFVIFDQETEKYKKEKNDQTGTQASLKVT